MTGFSEAWLRVYETRTRGRSVLGRLLIVRFTLAKPTILLNELLRMHYNERSRYQRRLSDEIARLTRDMILDQPFDRATVEIERYSVREPDHDGLVGGVKPLVDCLLPRSATHPHGLGFVVDDSPVHMTLKVSHVQSPTLKGQATTITITKADA